jgi:hypothetical protein
MATPSLHVHVCECPNRRCRHTFEFSVARYRLISELGLHVVHPDHVQPFDVVVSLFDGYAVVLPAAGRQTVARRMAQHARRKAAA